MHATVCEDRTPRRTHIFLTVAHLALKALEMIVSLAAMRDGRHRQRSIVFHEIVAAFVHTSKDEVGVFPKKVLLERGEWFLLLKAL